MPHVKMKIGSRLTLPIDAGWMVGSDNTSVVGASVSGWTLNLSANGVGTCTLSLVLASDLTVDLLVEVTL